MESGYYVCELRSLFNKGTYCKVCYYNEDEKQFYWNRGNITKRVVRVVKKDEIERL